MIMNEPANVEMAGINPQALRSGKTHVRPKRRMTVRTCADGVKRGGFAKRTPEEDIAAFHNGVRQGSAGECWPWQGAAILMGNKSGGKYGIMTFMGKPMRTHRVAYMIAHGLKPIPVGLVIRHTCNFGLCNNPAHLLLGTQQQNMDDAQRDGLFATGDRSGSRTHPERRPRGENNPLSKITEQDVLEIFELRAAGMTEKDIGKKFAVTDISSILNRTSWAHVRIPVKNQIDKAAAKMLHRKNNGAAHRRFSDDEIRLARNLSREGFTVTHIHRQLGKSYSQTRKIVHGEVHTGIV